MPPDEAAAVGRGSGWVQRIRSRSMTTTKSESVSTRTSSANGCRAAVGSAEADLLAHERGVRNRAGHGRCLVARRVAQVTARVEGRQRGRR